VLYAENFQGRMEIFEGCPVVVLFVQHNALIAQRLDFSQLFL